MFIYCHKYATGCGPYLCSLSHFLTSLLPPAPLAPPSPRQVVTYYFLHKYNILNINGISMINMRGASSLADKAHPLARMSVGLVDKKILDEISIAEISRQLERLVAGADKPRIALDFGSVAHMSSSMLGKLITLNKHVRERQGHMRLCNVQPAIYEVFVITRLSEVFHVTQTREQAVAELEAA